MSILQKFVAAAFFASALFSASAVTPAFAQATEAAAQARLNPNTATAAQLATVPNMTPTLIAEIESKRPFRTTADFHTLLSARLQPKQIEQVYPLLFVPIDLNRATSKEIALIPGMSRKMVHEFEEYRPYASLQQFNKEIGKYVPPKEVARLRSYVTLN